MFDWYRTHIFPRLMEWSLGTPRIQALRKQLLAPLQGTLLEIGFGTGLNVPFYPKTVTWVTAVEPENILPDKVTARSIEAPMPIELVRVSAERMPFDADRFDCVLSTLTLCTIPNALAALREVRRVLKPDGRFVFLEHGRGSDSNLVKWQERLNPIQHVIGCGYHLNRQIDLLIKDAGLHLEQLDRFQLEGVPKVAAQMYRGTASPAKI